jgi:outer membrane immunogenic protein
MLPLRCETVSSIGNVVVAMSMRRAYVCVLTVSAAFALVGSPALADGPYRTQGYAYASPWTWTGCYVGANVGWIRGDGDFVLTPSGNYSNPALAEGPGFPTPGRVAPNAIGGGLDPPDLVAVTHAYSAHDNGLTAGGQIGCNLQKGGLVFGLEGDWQHSGLDVATAARYGAIPSRDNPTLTIVPHTEFANSRLAWFSTLRGRVGVAWDHLLVYGTGGLALGRVESNTSVAFATSAVAPQLVNGVPVGAIFNGAIHAGRFSAIDIGWVVGGGVEYAIGSNWSLKAEYLHLFSLGDNTNYHSPLISPTNVAPGYRWSTNANLDGEDVVRVGLNYRFGCCREEVPLK